MDKYLGTLLDNRYEILEVIGTGGMAVVYKARDNRLNRLVAIKILKEDLALDVDFRRRFQTESQAVAMLSNPNIVAVYDVSKNDDVEYIVMELIEGITLKQYMNRKGQLNWKESLHFATQITKALSHAHSRGIIHRDIKPHNIMILKDGSVKVADFGIARLQDNQSSTLTQEALGSVHYISPEQAKGAQVDTRSDLYSVGVVLYEMLTSRLPFEGDSAVSVAIQHISSIPLSPREINPEIPAGLESITMKAMNPDLETRYQTADELLRDFEEFRKNPNIQFNYGGVMATAAAAGVAGAAASQAAKKADGEEDQEKKDAEKKGDDKKSKKEKERANNRKRRKKANRVSTLLGVGLVVVFLVLIAVFLYNFLLKDLFSTNTERVEVDNFVGMLADTVLNDSEYLEKYEFETQEGESDEYDEGYIYRQNPAADRTVQVTDDEKIKMTLYVATASDQEDDVMPNLVNKTYEEARITLDALSVDVTIVRGEEASDSITVGYITSTIPSAGEKITDGSTVYVWVSTGPKDQMVKVPDLYGMSLSVAITTLNNLDLDYAQETEYSSATAGTVIRQDISAGTEVKARTKVTITTSLGPEPTATPTPTETPVATPAPTQTPTATPAPTDPGGDDQDAGGTTEGE